MLKKFDFIYIDPPYNTGKDSFLYNDSFNHSTWLTFMKNRLELSKVSKQAENMSAVVDTLAAGAAEITTAVNAIDRMSRSVSGEAEMVSAATE